MAATYHLCKFSDKALQSNEKFNQKNLLKKSTKNLLQNVPVAKDSLSLLLKTGNHQGKRHLKKKKKKVS